MALSINDIPGVVLTLGLATIVGAAILIALSTMGNISVAGANSAGNANFSIQAAITAIGNIYTDWYELIVTVVIIGIVIGVMFLSFRGAQR